MSGFRYMSIPRCANRIQERSFDIKPKLVVSVPTPSLSCEFTSGPTTTQVSSSTKQTPSVSNLLLSSTVHLPNPPPASPRDGLRLLSTREPLSLQVTTVNFRRFVSRSGPIFWLQDRIEEVVFWKRGAKVTFSWMAIYSFLCCYPRLFLLLPHVILISILLETHDKGTQSVSEVQDSKTNSLPRPVREGSADWYANLQAIQNFMGAVSDLYDATLPFLPILTGNTPHTPHLLAVLCASLVLLIPIAIFVPLRPTLLAIGLTPFILTHPFSLRTLPAILHPLTRSLKSRAQHFIDDNNLSKSLWHSKKCTVELWENERWALNGGWAKSTLKVDETKPWSMSQNAWCDFISDEDRDGRNLRFMFSPGWQFIETEDWRLDREDKWTRTGTDDYGWVYTDDSWEDPHPTPQDKWRVQGMTRKRRWVRRIYFTTNL